MGITACFMAGAMLTHCQHYGWTATFFQSNFDSSRSPVLRTAVTLAQTVFKLALATIAIAVHMCDYDPGLRDALGHVLHEPSRYRMQLLGAVASVLVVDQSPLAQKIFSSPLPLFLGKISFALYLLHTLIMYGMGPWLFSSMLNAPCQAQPNYHVIGWFVVYPICIAVCIPAAMLFTRFVDRASVNLSHSIEAFCRNPRLPSIRANWRNTSFFMTRLNDGTNGYIPLSVNTKESQSSILQHCKKPSKPYI